jgi:protein CpxP
MKSSKFSPLLRPLVVASVVGSAVLMNSFAPASAQGTTNKPPAAAAATSTKPETVEARITALKTALKVTPDQEAKWNGVAKAMRDNASAMDKLVSSKRAASPASMTAVDDLKTYQEFSQAHLDGLKNLIAAFTTFYNAMPTEQKANADKVFESYGPMMPAAKG